MKANFIITSVLVLLSLISFAQQGNDQLVNIKVKNSSWFPKKCTLISYTPGGEGNGTVSYWLLPLGTTELKYKDGTRLYLANQKQVNTVMSGSSIDNGKPFLTVKKEDNDQTFEF
jgi:hypothetical protein